MKNDEINVYKIDKFDTQKFQDIFVEWFSQFKENVIDKEFENGTKGDGVIEETDKKLTFKFSTEWRVSIVKEDDDEDSEELKKEKEYNKKHGVEITETFPFPVIEDDEETKGNK